MRLVSLTVFLVLFAACMVHALYFYPLLPDVVASHFGVSGRPDAWSSRNFFVGVYLVSACVSALIFLAIVYGIPRTPDSMLNLPNKDYWLADERREETFDFFYSYFLWFGSATFLLLLDVFHQSFLVHLGKNATLKHPWLSIGLYLAFSLVWSIGLVVKFLRKKTG